MTLYPRVIPVLTIREGYLVKPNKFGKEQYIGDPINAVRIFNEKLVDELIIIDLDASENPGSVSVQVIEDIVSEAFMPVGYGGGVNSLRLAQELSGTGIEKIVINSLFSTGPEVITEISETLGSQSTVLSIDVRKRITGSYETFVQRGRTKLGLTPSDLAKRAEELGVGEIIVSSIDRESSFSGYDEKLLSSVLDSVNVPVTVLGGASGTTDFANAFRAGASGAAAGSTFVMQGKHRAVLITYPSQREIRGLDLTQSAFRK